MFELKIFKGSKNVNLRVLNSSSVRLSVPRFYNNDDCEKIIQKHRSWIESKLLQMRDKEFEIENLKSRNQILWFGQWRDFDEFGSDFDKIKEVHMQQLLKLLQELCFFWAQKMQVQFKSLRLSGAKSFFGVCTRDNHLRFSKMLAFAPKELIQYVVIHELAHIRYKNHSREFWEFVGQFCSDFKHNRAILRSKSNIYGELLDIYKKAANP